MITPLVVILTKEGSTSDTILLETWIHFGKRLLPVVVKPLRSVPRYLGMTPFDPSTGIVMVSLSNHQGDSLNLTEYCLPNTGFPPGSHLPPTRFSPDPTSYFVPRP